jgi:hypothetical protein
MIQQQPRNYLKKKNSHKPDPKKTHVRFGHQLPDSTVHNPPGAMFFIGGLGILAGIAANIWQFITTFTAFWQMFNPKGTPVDTGKQPVLFVICGMMAFSFQFALMMLVFRLDATWKKHQVTGQVNVQQYSQAKRAQFKSTAIEIVQHVNLVLLWGGLGFVVDTIGDYSFITTYTTALDPATSVFIIFCYAIALYALSTVAFVRSIEYLWAGFAAADHLKQQNQMQH